MSEEVIVYVLITNEAVDVWRPVSAERIAGDVYRLSRTIPDEDEVWQFPAGSTVRCKQKTFPDGTIALVAFETDGEQLAQPDASSGSR